MTTPHDFKGTLVSCLICFRKRSDPIHTVMPIGIHTVATSTDKEHKSMICDDLALANEPDISSFSVFRPLSEEEEALTPEFELDPDGFESSFPLPPSLDAHIAEVVEIKQEAQHKGPCKGHACATCNRVWYHDYDCSAREQKPALCPECCAQAAVEINRPQAIEQYAQLSSHNLNGREIVECMLDHEHFVVHELIYDPQTNKEYPNWMERVNAHRRDIARQIEKWKIKELATSKAVMAKHKEDVAKLSPEQIAQYKRDARRGKTATATATGEKKAEKTPKPIDAKTAYDKLLKSLVGEIKTRRKSKGLVDLDDVELLAQAEKKYKAMNEEEE